jgi:hypothetical protein
VIWRFKSGRFDQKHYNILGVIPLAQRRNFK